MFKFALLLTLTCICGTASAQSNLSTGELQARREGAWQHAVVWQEPEILPFLADLSVTTGGTLQYDAETIVECRFLPDHPRGHGRTEKFYCETPEGRVIKVKYELEPGSNKEVQSEVIGTRLLRALGFGADIVHMPKKVVCWGCPRDPFREEAISFDLYTEFEMTAIEEKMSGTNLEVSDEKNSGWSFGELQKIPVTDASVRDVVDGFVLFAAFLQAADTKRDNLKFVCLPGYLSHDGKTCGLAMPYMHDLGAIMGGEGGRKLTLETWAKTTQVWTTESKELAESCHVSRPHSYMNATFPSSKKISEGGRVWLYRLLGQLRREQIEDLYRGARIPEHEVGLWADQFELRIRYLNASNLKCDR